MGWDFCETKAVKKTRKDHLCEFCGRTILKGSPNIFNWSGKFDGKMVNSYACHWCMEHEDRLVDGEEILDFWDCLWEDIFYDKRQELRKQGYEDVILSFDKEDPDWIVLINEGFDGDKEVYREYMPIV